ncbi:MAG: TolC family outer membrane protein [Caldimonas sp.]
MRHSYAAVALVAFAGFAGLPSAKAANLGAIYALALANDAPYAAAVQTAAAGREKAAQGRALLRPTVGISGNVRRNHDESSVVEGDWSHGNYNSGSVSLTANQPLMRQANLATYEQGLLQAQLADQQLKLAEQDLLVRVSRGYFEVLQAQDALGTVGAQKEAFAGQLAQAKRSYDVGLAPVTDVNEAQSRYDLTVAQEIAARNDLEVKRRTLEKAIGRELPPLAVLDANVSIDVLPAEVQQALFDSASRGALQVAIGRTAEQIANYEVAKQDAGHLPTFDLVLNIAKNHNVNTGNLNLQRTSTASIGIEFGLPVYQGGAITSRVREAVANLGRAQSELDNARRQALLDARQALLGVQSGVALNTALRQAVSSAETQTRSTRRGLEVGIRTRVDVLNAEQQLYTTRRDLSAARYQALIAGLQLRAAAGVLSEQDLRSLDALLRE